MQKEKIVLIFSLLLLMFFSPSFDSVVSAYNPPIGIPAPTFGIDETYRMYDFSTNRNPNLTYYLNSEGGYYTDYIDQNNPNATDINNPHGTATTPRKTLPYPLYLKAGEVVEIHGPYTITETGYYNIMIFSDPNDPPTALKPVFIRGLNGGEIDRADGAFLESYANVMVGGAVPTFYMIIENMLFNRVPFKIVGSDTHHIAIRNCEIKETRGGPAGVMPTDYGRIHDVVFYNNNFHNSNDRYLWTDSIDEDNHGIDLSVYGATAGTFLDHVWVLDNQIYHVSGNGVQLTGTSDNNQIHDIYLGRNIIHSNRQPPFGIKESRDVIISQNIMYDNLSYNQTNAGICYQYGPDNLWIIYNEIYDSVYGIIQTDTPDGVSNHSAYIVGNYIHDIGQYENFSNYGSPQGWGVTFFKGGMKRYVVNNTFSNVNGGIEAMGVAPIYMENNIINNLKKNEFIQYNDNGNLFTLGRDYNYHIAIDNPAPNNEASMDNNLLYGQVGNTSQGALIKWGANQFSSLADAQSTIVGSNNTEASPLLNGVALQSNSLAAINHGLALDVYQTFQTLYGSNFPGGIANIRADFVGNPRPQGTAWDIGAFEYAGTGSGPIITSQLLSQSTNVGSSAIFSVTATGSGLSYQWQRAGVNILGATSSTYQIQAVALRDAGDYTVIVTNLLGSVTSNMAMLTVNTGTITTPVITVQPLPASANIGSSATFTVVATGTGNLSYKWQVLYAGQTIWVDVPGFPNSPNYITPQLTLANNGDKYRCIVTNAGGSTTSRDALVTVTSGTSLTSVLQDMTMHQFTIDNNPGITLQRAGTANDTQMTVSVWVKRNNVPVGGNPLGRYPLIVDNQNANQPRFFLGDPYNTTANEPFCFSLEASTGSNRVCEATSESTTARWVNYAGVFNGTTITLYKTYAVNGVITTETYSTPLGTTFINTTNFVIYGNSLPATIANLMIFNTALTKVQVLAVASNTPINPPPTNTPPFAQSQSVTLSANTPKPIVLTATDDEHDPLTYSITPQLPPLPEHGSLVHDPAFLGDTSKWIYTSTPNYSGSDTFNFKANDGKLDSFPAAVFLTITAVPGGGGGIVRPPIVASCAPSFPSVTIGDTVTWIANASGGMGIRFTYHWSGYGTADNPGANAFDDTIVSATEGVHTEQLTVTDPEGHSATASCSVTVMPTTIASCSASSNPVPQYQPVTWTATPGQGNTYDWGPVKGASNIYVDSNVSATPGTYTQPLTVTGPAGTATTTCSVVVNPFSPPVITMNADSTQLSSGQTATISWSATDAASCQGSTYPATDLGWNGPQNTSGFYVYPPSVWYAPPYITLILTCDGPGGSSTQSVFIQGPGSVGLNIRDQMIASISSAIQGIMQQIQAMLKK